jgi:diketogulonate reductase-like aldo/keto reductase
MILNLESHAKLNNGVEIPRLGLGVYQSPPGKTTEHAVSYALKIGYRHVDTAYLYGNESDVGKALHEMESVERRCSLLQRCGTATRDITLHSKPAKGA